MMMRSTFFSRPTHWVGFL